MAELTNEEVFGTVQAPAAKPVTTGVELSHSAVFDVAPPFEAEAKQTQTLTGAATDIAKGVGTRLAGTAAQVSDMFTGIGKSLLGSAVYWGARTSAQVQGESAKTAASAAQMTKDYFFPPEISAPWSKVAEALGPDAKAAYEDNPVAWIMGKVGDFIQRGSTAAAEATGLQPEDFAALADQFMGSIGYKAVKPGVVKAFKARVEEMKAGGEAKAAAATITETPEGVPLENPDPTRYRPQYDAEGKLSEWEDISKPISEKDLGVVTSKEVKAIFERAKKGEALKEADVDEVKALFDKAKKQGGEIDPELLKWMAGSFAAGAGGMALYEIYKGWQAHKEEVRDLKEKLKEYERQREPPTKMPTDRKPFVTAAAIGAMAPMLIGAMRVKGTGVWSPKAVEGLRDPLWAALSKDTPERLALSPIIDTFGKWTDKRVTDYLNRHAGTESDPLKDIKIPVGDEMKRWEEVTDKAFEAARIPERLQLMKEGKAQIGEPIWSLAEPVRDIDLAIHDFINPETSALKSYLSHVGDYLRLNVDPAKLGQYDLVRAVKESAANDERVAKLAEKARAASSKELPTVKEYPDGMRWVEIKAPETLTAEQMKRVREATQSERQGLRGQTDLPPEYIALDAQGKPIRNNYTQNIASGSTPQQAFLAGRLAEEGNVMGHCVGGYVDEVFSGQSRIFSLRDAKGESHVTIEVRPPRNRNISADFDTRGERETFTTDIEQIKGKQNRAPDARYLPAVQDFVKTQGPWGEVGDLENTGLRDISTPAYASVVANALLKEGRRYVTADEWNDANSYIAPKQRGASTPEHLGALAAAGLGGVIGLQDSDSPIRSGIYGALAGLVLGHPAGRAALKTVIKSPDVALGAISTRLGNMHPALKLMERRHELNILRQIDQLNDQVLPFAQAFDKLPKEQQLAAGRMLMNGQEPMLQTIPTLAPTLPGLRRALGGLEGQLKSLGRFKEGLSGYFPRMVRDLEGLKGALGAQYAVGIEKALVNAEAEMIRKAGRGLTDVEQSLVVNRYLHAADQTSFQPGFAKGRKVGEITSELQPFYEPPVESLLRYITGAVSDIQTAKFFGRDLKVNKQGAKVSTNVDDSIGNLAARLINEGKITREQGLELRDILKARFEGGDKGMSQGLAAARNLTNTALLGNLASAATQVGDSLTTIYHQGTVPVIQALAQKIIGRQRITPKQLGLINHVAEELSEMGITGRALHNTMKYSGFHTIDMFAKGLLLNASLIRNTKLASTPKGTAQLIERYGKAFGDEMPQLLEDLRNRRMSDNVETLAFSELSDAQPVSKAEMPEAYLRHPNGRILYQLKTYMMKQVDVVRRDVYQNIASGNPKRIMIGAKNLAALGAVYALANVPGDAIKDILAGRDVDPFTTPKLVENVLQTFGINRYAQEQLLKGKVVETATGLMTPPVRVFQDIAKTAHTSGDIAPDWKAVGYVPLVGRPLYERYFGGNERREISEKRSANVGVPKAERQQFSPAAKEYLRQKRLDAAAKKMQREQR